MGKNRRPGYDDNLRKLVAETAIKLDNLVTVVDEMVKSSPDYYGGLQVKLFLEDSKDYTFFMVSDMFVNDPFLEFYHLMPVNSELLSSMSLSSFPQKPEKQRLATYVRKVGKDARWNRMHEQFYASSIVRIQTLGCFMYSKFWNAENNQPKIDVRKGSIVPFKPPK